jgi:ketosteroid isomerase-like protein
MGDVVVTPQGNDLIITYRIQLAGERAGIPLPDHRLSYMSVWQQRKDGWELVAQSRSDSR